MSYEVTEAQKIQTEHVSRSGLDAAQQSRSGESSRQREGCALRDTETIGDFGDAETAGAVVGDLI